MTRCETCDFHEDKSSRLTRTETEVATLKTSDAEQWERLNAVEKAQTEVAGVMKFLKWAIPATIAGSTIVSKLLEKV